MSEAAPFPSMSLDYQTLDLLRQKHPAWRLLRAEHAPLIASFLQRAFIAPNVRDMAQSDLVRLLDDFLFDLRERHGTETFPRPALEYLNDWASNDRAWLRKFYRPGSDEPHFDLTPATEKAIAWLGSLSERAFVGTESRLLTLFELLRQMTEGTQTDPEIRLAELARRRADIDAEMERVASGKVPVLDSTAIKERFQQFIALARDLLTDFREVEQNFRRLDRNVRERIALWEGGKGALLDDILGARDAIADSDQGRSFRAFWDFLMSSQRQEELSELLDRVLALPAVHELAPDGRTRRIHYDWLEAGEHTQHTVAQLSRQLRRFLDDQAWQENRRIMDILRQIEAHAIVVRDAPPPGEVAQIDDVSPTIDLPFERPLHAATFKPHITEAVLQAGEGDFDASALYEQVVVDKTELARHIRHVLQGRSQVTLRELCDLRPLRQGLAELVAYLVLSEEFGCAVKEGVVDTIVWETPEGASRQANLPRVVFDRQGK